MPVTAAKGIIGVNLMGMFDYLKCEYPLPDLPDLPSWEIAKGADLQNDKFQTKDFECQMRLYTITKDGLLLREEGHHKEVPENERPYYGMPEWDREPELYKSCGSLKWVKTGDSFIQISNTIRFYTTYDDDNKWLEYEASFENGRLKDISRVIKKEEI